jgi:hypothetical protein
VEKAGGCVYIYFHRAVKYHAARIQVPVTAVDDNVLWCVREDAKGAPPSALKERRDPSYPYYYHETIITSTSVTRRF